MDKSVYNMKAEKIQRAVKNKDFETAVKICDTIDWSEITSVRMLGMVSDVYEHVGRYDTAIDILLMAYEEAPVGRRFLYKLTELALKAGNIREAEDFYRQFLKEAPEDNGRYILRYKIAEAKGEPLDKRITILEAYKRKEFDEEWAFNLASLYHKANDRDRCVALCDDIILWFGVGPYVDKALAMKEEYEELTGSQLDHRINRAYYEDNLRRVVSEMESSGEAGTAGEIYAEKEEPAPLQLIREEEDASRIRTAKEPAEEKTAQSGDTIRLPSLAALKAVAEAPAEAGEAGMEEAVRELIESERKAEADKVRTAAAEQIQTDFRKDERRPMLPGNVLILSAETPQEAMAAAAGALSEVHAARGEAPAEVARISAKKLDERGLRNSLPLLRGKDLAVLGAGFMSTSLLMELKLVSERVPKMVFALLDSPAGVELLYRRIANEAPAAKPVAEPAAETVVVDVAAVKAAVPDGDESEADATVVLPKIRYEAAEPAEEAADEIREERASLDSDTIVIPSIRVEEEENILPEIVEREAFDPEEIHVAIEEPQVVPTALEPAEPVQEDIFTIHLADLKPTEDLAGAAQAERIEKEEEIPSITMYETRLSEAAAPDEVPEQPAEAGLDEDAFVACITDYAKQIDCVLDDDAEEGLLELLDDFAEDGTLLTGELAAQVVEAAADDAEKRGGLFRSRYDKEGNLILRARNFIG